MQSVFFSKTSKASKKQLNRRVW